MKNIMIIILSLATLTVQATERHGAKRCSAKPSAIVTACDLKAYSVTRPGTVAFAVFQGAVIGMRAAVTPQLCAYTITDADLVAAVQSELIAAVDCTEQAAALVSRILQNSPSSCL